MSETRIDRHQVGRTAGRERPGRHARRRASRLVTSGVRCRDRSRTTPFPGEAIWHGRGECFIAQVAQDAHLGGQVVGDHEVELAASRCVDRLDVGDAHSDG